MVGTLATTRYARTACGDQHVHIEVPIICCIERLIHGMYKRRDAPPPKPPQLPLTKMVPRQPKYKSKRDVGQKQRKSGNTRNLPPWKFPNGSYTTIIRHNPAKETINDANTAFTNKPWVARTRMGSADPCVAIHLMLPTKYRNCENPKIRPTLVYRVPYSIVLMIVTCTIRIGQHQNVIPELGLHDGRGGGGGNSGMAPPVRKSKHTTVSNCKTSKVAAPRG